MMENSSIATSPVMPVLLKNHSSTTIDHRASKRASGRTSRRRAHAAAEEGKSAGERERGSEGVSAQGGHRCTPLPSPPLLSSPHSFLSWDRGGRGGVRVREESERGGAAAAAAAKKRGGKVPSFARSLAVMLHTDRNALEERYQMGAPSSS